MLFRSNIQRAAARGAALGDDLEKIAGTNLDKGAEIDENLIRANLTPAQEAVALSRRKAIYEALHPETKAGVAGAHASNRAQGRDAADNLSVAFTSATSQATGKDERTIRRAAARGAALGDDLEKIAGTSLDKGVEIDALAKMTPEQRAPIIEAAKSGESVSARNKEPTRMVNTDLERLMSAWSSACEDARKEFLKRIDRKSTRLNSSH